MLSLPPLDGFLSCWLHELYATGTFKKLVKSLNFLVLVHGLKKPTLCSNSDFDDVTIRQPRVRADGVKTGSAGYTAVTSLELKTYNETSI